MIVVFLLCLIYWREIDMDWIIQEGFVLEREKLLVKDFKQYYYGVFG